LARVQLWSGQYEAAETTARQALSIVQQTAPPNSPRRLMPVAVLGDTLMLLECYEEAEKYLLAGLALARSLSGNTGDHVPTFLNSLAELRIRQGRLQEAETLARESIPLDMLVEGETPEIAGAHTVLAFVLLRAGRANEAIAEARAALAILSRTSRPNHPYVASAQHVLGEALCRTGEFVECERALLAEIPIWKDSNAPQWRVARAMSALGEAVLGQGRLAEAAQHLALASEQLEGLRGAQQSDARRATQERLQLLEKVRQGVPLLAARSDVLTADSDAHAE
jgi:tetratricopeptide (TPR) repeat protein